ncbi:RNA dependent RNA polymerase [Plasmopara viticola lesion associated mononegaambi virus 4]|uniref:RNA-directed RNA polymerase L n=1 Tax=Plasmopara viticola lesion associated mononegaambi virus 4 TaxID=2692016 RepID=A0A6B9Q4K9_9MONO|nr:RNA dependent RNA polymerase [Plasmopara viticola lesion associated mononegaambi virus 4]QHD64774.1 RNA dependent RNA polymerase [Plasmopara viticola lesion associated mononegaambi virus 4]
MESDGEAEFLKPSKVFFLDTNLSSPVIDIEIEDTRKLLLCYRAWITKTGDIRHNYTEFKTELSFFKKLAQHRGWKSADLVQIPSLSPTLYSELERQFLIAPLGFRGHYPEALEIAQLIEKAVADGLEARGLPRESIEGTSQALNTPAVEPYRLAYEQFCNLYGRAESRVKTSEHIWTFGSIGNVKVWINSRHALVEFNGSLYYSSANQVLMLKDKLATRYMLMEHVRPLRLGDDLITHLQELYKWQDFALDTYGNEAYELLKAVEPMFKTRLSHVTDDVFGNDTAYTRMKVKMNEKEYKIMKTKSTPLIVMPQLYDLVEKVSTLDHLVELFGCQKSCGHPIIDPRRGGLSAAAEARTPDTTKFTDAQCLRNHFCHIILTTYIEKNGRWPPLKFLKKGLKLELLNSRQERDISYRSYNINDWTFVEWGKIFEMDYFPNFLELMDDKSISYYRSEKHLSWDKGKTSSQRRLLLEVLRRKEINIKEIVERVSKRDIPFEWFIVSLYPKEREFKLDPRMFAMLVLEMRCFFTCIEANIADNVFKYMPQQTMTKTKTQIQEKFLAFTDPHKNKDHHTLFLEIDLSRWNLRWREMCAHMVGHDLNNMFGVKGTFTVTHWFFALCQIVVRVAGLRPEGIEKEYPPESSEAWRGHKGGFEGLNQKLWSALTYAMVAMALAALLAAGIIHSYELIGQGDNQVLRIIIPKTDEPREIVLPRVRDLVNKALTDTCASVGQEVKAEENVEGTEVVTYSKDVFASGVEYPTTLKKHSRLFPVTASDFPSTAANASAIMAGAVAGAENSRHTLCSAVVGWYHTARYLLATSDGYSIHGNGGPKFSRSRIIAALILPPSIGGLIGTPIASFLYKGGSDPLGKEISSLRLLSESDNEVGVLAGRALRGLEEKYCFDPQPNIETLIDNPYALPIDKTTSPLGQVSNLTLEAFRGKVMNKDIRPLLDRSVEVNEKKLKNDILSIRPLNPILAHDLFEASGFGTVKVMRKMFLNTRTVQAVAQWVNPSITHNFLRADVNDLLWFFSWVKGLPKLGYSKSSSFTIVTNARAAWGVPLAGVTNYQPLDCKHSAGSVRDRSSIKWSAHAGQNLLYVRGTLSGYLGTATREKRSEHGYKIVDAGAPSRAIMKLQTIRSQANGNMHLNELLDRIGLTRTNCKLSWITDVLSKVIGGSIAHKFASVVRNMAASYVGPLNFITHIRLDTDSLGKVSGGSDNYSIMTQEHMVLCLSGAKLLYMHRDATCGELLVDTDSMVPIPDDALTATEPVFETASLPKTKLLFTPDLILQRTFDNTVRSVPRGSMANPTAYDTMEMIEHGFTGFFVEMLRNQNGAKLLADTRGLAALPARLQIDIAEAHAMGVSRLAVVMAKAIWISNLRDTFRTIHLHPERWDEALFMSHNIATCVRACSNYLRHPLCWSHPDFDQIRGSGLRYSSSFSIQKRMEALVKRHLINIYRHLNHKFWEQDIPVFAGDNSMSLIEGVSVAAIKCVYPLYLTHHPRAREFSGLLSSYTRISATRAITPEQQLEVLRVRLTKLAHVFNKLGDAILSSKMIQLSHMKGVRVFNDDARAVMRYARNLSVVEGEVRPRRIKPLGVPPLMSADACEKCLPKPVTKHEAIWTKNERRPHGGISAAGYTWLPLLATLRIVKSVFIVGSGNGGLADLLLSAFNCSVTGMDLEADMPREAATLLNYVPVGVQMQNAKDYTQSDLSISTSGDWFDKNVRHEVYRSLVERTTLMVDITSRHADYGWVEEALKEERVDSVCFRFIGGDTEFSKTLSLINTYASVRAWVSTRTYSEMECIFEVRRPKHVFNHDCVGTARIPDLITDSMHSCIPERFSQLVEAATLSAVALQPTNSLTDVKTEIDSLCRSLLNKAKNRQLLYKDRISLVWAHITMEVAVSDNPTALIQEWISDEMVETSLLKYPIRESLVSHLIRYVPRLRNAIPV